MEMEFVDHEEYLEPVSPTSGCLKSSALSVTIFGVLESEKPIEDEDNYLAMQLLRDVFLPINPRFSSIMVTEKNGEKKWKRVKFNLEDHIIVPIFPQGKSLEYYDEYFKKYLEKIAMEHLPQDRPLWEIHIIKYPTSNAAGNVVFKLHHALGDGYSLVGALLSCLQRRDNPSLPLTFPSRESKTNSSFNRENNSNFSFIPGFFWRIFNTLHDFSFNVLKSTVAKDDYSPIRSSEEGIEFRQIAMVDMTIPLDRIKKITTRLKVTINDAITGVIFYGTRLYMEEMDYKSSMCNSTGLLVLNTRALGGYKSVSEMIKPDAEMRWGNQIGFLHVKLPKLSDSKSSNPLDFVFGARTTIQKKRNSAAVYLTAKLLQILSKLRGPEVAARFFYDAIRNSSVGVTNLIGPVEKMALADHPIKGLYFFLSGAPLNIIFTLVSYTGSLRICITVEKDFIDPYKFKSCIENSFELIFQAAVHHNSGPTE